MDNYLLFLDEANVTPVNPFFCLAGLIIKRDVYESDMIPQINALKEKYFGNSSVVFHYTDMKKNKDPFSALQDGTTRSAFWQEFNSTVGELDFITVGTYLDFNRFKECYTDVKNRHYETAFTRLINNYISFLKQNGDMGSIIFESRQWKENADVQAVFHHILECGTDIYTAAECKKHLSTIGFIIKQDNCIGLQLADFVPDSFVRNLNGQKNYNNVGTHFMNKRLSINGSHQDVVGLSRIV